MIRRHRPRIEELAHVEEAPPEEADDGSIALTLEQYRRQQEETADGHQD